MKYSIIFFFSVFSIQPLLLKGQRIASTIVSKDSNRLAIYKIINKGDSSYFIPNDFQIGELKNDSIILESYPKSKIIKYYAFIPPKLLIFKSGSTKRGSVKTYLLPSKRNIKWYIRVFRKNFTKYASENKITAPTEADFVSFEEKYSFLIEVVKIK